MKMLKAIPLIWMVMGNMPKSSETGRVAPLRYIDKKLKK